MRFVLESEGLRNPILLVFSQFKKGNGNRSEGMFLIGFVFLFLGFPAKLLFEFALSKDPTQDYFSIVRQAIPSRAPSFYSGLPAPIS
ncbi:MAG: hypothetical protein C0433_10220 [Cyclobacterium sp.]|nr:hypothetical protein [Cyclobacterium sp.]